MSADNQPLVSVGVPTYNRPQTLRRTLHSLTRQTYRKLEIILSDNCSTDPEVQHVISEFAADPRILLTVQPVNKGYTFNFNFVLQKASGDYFMWLADDDWLDNTYIEACVNFLEKHADYAGVYGLAELHASDGKNIGYDVKMTLEVEEGTERIKNYLSQVRQNGCFTALTRKRSRSFQKMKHEIASDWIMVSRLLFTGKYKALETTHMHLSCAGLSSSMINLTKSMPAFTRRFPHFAISLNISRDILFGKAYRRMGLLNKIGFAKQCFKILYQRHLIGTEIKTGVRRLLKFRTLFFW